MGCCGGKKKKKEGEEDEGDGKCVVSPNAMKLITLITLLVSDFDIIFTSESQTLRARERGRGGRTPWPARPASPNPPSPWPPLDILSAHQ